ncbi:unnamed protein product, partial [Amoebophrya sp. A25]
FQAAVQELYYVELCKIYHKHNPAKASNLKTVMDKNRGKEQLLFEGVCDKYSIKNTGEFSKINLPLQKKLVILKVKWSIYEIFRKCNTSKIAELDTVMMKYQNKELSLYEAVCRKYNVSPDTGLVSALEALKSTDVSQLAAPGTEDN